MQAAALFVTASTCVGESTTYGARQYYMGVRDAFEAVFRACYSIEDDADIYVYAVAVLNECGPEKRDAALRAAQDLLKARRRASVDETLTAV